MEMEACNSAQTFNHPIPKTPTSEDNEIARGLKSMEEGEKLPPLVDDQGEETSDVHLDEEIQRDAANDCVAFTVHIALACFAVMFLCAIVGATLIVVNYGFVAFAALLILVGLFLFITYFVTRIVVNDKKLKPVREKMQRWQKVAKAVVINEMRKFQLDMKDHQVLFLTNAADYEDLGSDTESTEEGQQRPNASDEDNDANQRDVNQRDANQRDATSRKRKSRRPRSMIFRIAVKPFLKEKVNKRAWFRRKKQKAVSEVNFGDSRDTNDDASYLPPVIESA
uniref:Uncharacterized protein n=1 Tax=Ditylum brightwellii TaxID=49249 RepID=A0A7S2EGU7_9STRA